MKRNVQNEQSEESKINWTPEGIDKMLRLVQAKKEGRFDEVFKELYPTESSSEPSTRE